MHRTDGYDKMASETLMKSQAARQEFLLSLINDHDMEPEEALKEAILTMGQTEFSTLVDMSVGRIGDFIKGRRKLKYESFNALLHPFGLQAKIVLEKLKVA